MGEAGPVGSVIARRQKGPLDSRGWTNDTRSLNLQALEGACAPQLRHACIDCGEGFRMAMCDL